MDGILDNAKDVQLGIGVNPYSLKGRVRRFKPNAFNCAPKSFYGVLAIHGRYNDRTVTGSAARSTTMSAVKDSSSVMLSPSTHMRNVVIFCGDSSEN